MAGGGQETANLEAYLEQGGELYESDPKSALAAYYQVVTLEPGHVEAWNQIGRLMFDMQQYAEAEMVFSRVETLARGQGLYDWAEMAAQNVELTRQVLSDSEAETAAAEEMAGIDAISQIQLEDDYEIPELAVDESEEQETDELPGYEEYNPNLAFPPDVEAERLEERRHEFVREALPEAHDEEGPAVEDEAEQTDDGEADKFANLMNGAPSHQFTVGEEEGDDDGDGDGVPSFLSSQAGAPLRPIDTVDEKAVTDILQRQDGKREYAPQPSQRQPQQQYHQPAQQRSFGQPQQPQPPRGGMPVPGMGKAESGEASGSRDGGKMQPFQPSFPPVIGGHQGRGRSQQPHQPNMPQQQLPPRYGQAGTFQPLPPTGTPIPRLPQPNAQAPQDRRKTMAEGVPLPPNGMPEMQPQKSSVNKMVLMGVGLLLAIVVGAGAAIFMNSGSGPSSDIPTVVRSEEPVKSQESESAAANGGSTDTAEAAKPTEPKVPKPEEVGRDQAYNIGMSYMVKGEFDQGRPFLEKAESLGHPEASYQLAFMYLNGHGVEKDEAKVIHYLERAADRGYYPAMTNLAMLYAKGENVQQDYSKARELWLKAAEGEQADAMHNLGVIYATGMGVEKNMQEAIKWYRRAANAGFVNSMVSLGAIYANAEGVPQDLNEAKRLWEMAADKGHPVAKENLRKLEEYMKQKKE